MPDKLKFAEEEAQGYRIEIIGRNLYVTEGMKQHAFSKISKIDRFHHRVMDVHVTLDIHKLEHSATIVLQFDHLKIKVGAKSTDMYISIDKAVEKLQVQILRWKSRIQEHHKKARPVVILPVDVLQKPFTTDLDEINAEIELAERKTEIELYHSPKVIGTETRTLKILTLDEAVMKMELSGDAFMLFKGEEDHKLKVIYRRSDGNYGIILSA